jgi:hypothetical protein
MGVVMTMVLLLTHQGTRYEPTAEDLLWMARAVEAEGRPQELVAQTLVNGFLWSREQLGSKRTLGEWAQAYSQPISPAWMPGGQAYEEALATARDDTERAAIQAQGWRRQQEHATRTTFSSNTREAIRAALTGPPRFPGAVDFAAAWVQKPATWRAFTFPTASEKVNRLWARPGALGWPGYRVENGGSTAKGATPWLAGAAIGVLVLMRTRKSRR